jgi:hypothetical protein
VRMLMPMQLQGKRYWLTQSAAASAELTVASCVRRGHSRDTQRTMARQQAALVAVYIQRANTSDGGASSCDSGRWHPALVERGA